MTKSQIRDMLNRRIEYHVKSIQNCKAGKLLHFDTPEKQAGWIEEQTARIAEDRAIGDALHITGIESPMIDGLPYWLSADEVKGA